MTESSQRFPLMIVPQPVLTVIENRRVSDWGGVDAVDSAGTASPVPYLRLLPDNDEDQPGSPDAGNEMS